MTKLKSAEELIKLYYVNQEDFIEVIKQAQLDAIQATVEMCAEEAEVVHNDGELTTAILNVATQMKAELNLPKLE